MMRLRSFAAILAVFALAMIGVSLGAGAASTTQVVLSQTAFTDLGAAPVQVQTLSGYAQVVVADSLPTPQAGGTNVPIGPPITFQPADAASHVYALAYAGTATISYVSSLQSVATIPSNPATAYSGQQTLTLSAAALPSQALVNGIVLTAKTSNTGTVYVGPAGVTTATGYPLIGGQSISYGVTNLNALYVIGTNTSDVVTFTGN